MSKRSAAKGHGKGGEAPTRATVQSEEGGKAMAQLLKQCGVRQFDPRVAGQLLAVMRRHVREALGSAAYLASHSGRGYISAVDVEEASRLSLDAFLSRSESSSSRRLARCRDGTGLKCSLSLSLSLSHALLRFAGSLIKCAFPF